MGDRSALPEHERDYYEARAEQELELAQRAPHPAAVRSHYLLAESYLDLAYAPDRGVPNESEEGRDEPQPWRDKDEPSC